VPQAAIAHEAMMDALADQLGIDRLEFRHRNALRVGDIDGDRPELAHSAGLAQCLEALRPHWRKAQTRSRRSTHGRRARRGVGVGCMWYGIGNTSMSNPRRMRIGLSRDGTLTLYSGALDIGQGSNTIMAQIAADALGLPVAQFALVTGDTDLTADAGKTSASRQTFVSGKAAESAGRDLRQQILRLANAGPTPRCRSTAHAHGARRRRGAHARPRHGGPLMGEGTFDPPTTPLDATAGRALMRPMPSRPDRRSRGRYLPRHGEGAAHGGGARRRQGDQPDLVEGQIEGGIAQGLGLALMEEYLPGRTENLHDYLIRRSATCPEIECLLIEDREPLGPSAPRVSASRVWCRPQPPSWAPSIMRRCARHARSAACRTACARPSLR
jgi:CO/xanthine dehydrogenase Mo-binding subunit